MPLPFALLLQASTPVPAPPPRALPPLHGGPAPMTCPVGGESYSAWQPTMYSTYGERPDGRPYSYLPFPFPLPECPSNKLVVWSQFSPAEVDRLAALIARDEYKRLVGTETPYFRAYWLADRLGRPRPEGLWLLLTATWEVKGGSLAPAARPDKARTYGEALVRGVATLPAGVDPKERAALMARAANVLRELGRFGAAAKTLVKARAELAKVPDRSGDWGSYLDRLASVVARQDSSIEPLDMIPPMQAALICRERAGKLTKPDQAICATPDVAAKVEQLKL